MKKMILLLLLPLLLAAGCSLTDADAQAPGSAQLRLLTGTGGSTTLSDPDHDDWSPQMVNWGGKNYLYFVSSRPYAGKGFYSGWEAEVNKPHGTHGVFRAEEVAPGVFTNLRLFYQHSTTEEMINSIAVISNGAQFPMVLLTVASGDTTNSGLLEDDGNGAIVPNSDSLYSGYAIFGGAWLSAAGYRVFYGQQAFHSRLFTLSQIPQSPSVSVSFRGLEIRAEDGSYESEGYAVLSIKPDLSEINPLVLDAFLQYYKGDVDQLRYNQAVIYRGSGPALFTTDGTDTRFGFYVSLGGRLLQIIYLDSNDYESWAGIGSTHSMQIIVQNPVALGFQRIIPLFSLTHYAGTIDKDPAYDQRNGNLFFASDRAGRGNFDLYYVPQEYLRVPAEVFNAVLPEW